MSKFFRYSYSDIKILNIVFRFPIKAEDISENDLKCDDLSDFRLVIARERSSLGIN